MSLPGERALIEVLTAEAESVRNRSGFQDDCAVIPMGSLDLVATVDTFAAPTHLPAGTPARAAGRFATSAALSDLAAAGADPLGVLVAYGLPDQMDVEDVQELARGVLSSLRDFGGEVLGGDTKPRPFLELTVTALGQAPPGKAMTRGEAEPGDTLIVTGPLGGAGAALDRIEQGLDPGEADPLLDPTPRIRAGSQARKLGVGCAMDLSDGLADAAVAIAEASGVRLVVEAASLPLHPWAGKTEAGMEHALFTGGDYELLFSVPGALQQDLLESLVRAGADPTPVGRVERGSGAVLSGPGGEEQLTRGYEHTFGANGG